MVQEVKGEQNPWFSGTGCLYRGLRKAKQPQGTPVVCPATGWGCLIAAHMRVLAVSVSEGPSWGKPGGVCS